jgi:hypothetical protein
MSGHNSPISFAWQGFAFFHPATWDPKLLVGSYSKGYVRLEGESGKLLQLRWEKVKKPPTDLRPKTLEYFSALEKAARKKKQSFSGELDFLNPSEVNFHWHAASKGYGRIWHDQNSERLVLIEESGPKKGSFKKEFREFMFSIKTYKNSLTPWKIFGLSVQLPGKFLLKSSDFKSGRIKLEFESLGCQLTCERWALAEQILKRHDFKKWASEVTGMNTVVCMNSCQLELSGQPSIIGKILKRRAKALVKYDQDQNHFQILKSEYQIGMEPQWEWLG